ncbi:MAG: PAS domain-containing protein [Leptolyngbyaceae cyanobacterium bins.302]|nr:PAS domain-containing protein [Leptolyngbyaceae cyanobacterium bins.302]
MNEELQSSNEELETTNEELQSTNEELETMNEELQSTNEELQTINDELRQRTNDLNQANAFLNSILTSIRAGVIVVDPQFNILSWNTEAENLWGLRAEEVQGESLFGLDIGLPVEQLREPIRSCLSGQVDQQEIMLNAVNRRGRTMQCRISCNPLVGFDRDRQGVILLMEEVEP